MENIERKIIDVLLVDDDEDEYVIARDLFSEIGKEYKVHWFSLFDEAIEEIINGEYQICILDYHMGAHNGIEFINKAVTRNCEVPIILLTGQGDREIDIGAMKAGAVDYLDKNKLDADMLSRSVRYALERKKSEDKIRFLAYYDQLTHLPNRTLFLDRLNNTIAAAKRHERIFALMFLDIDNFKRINDSLGHNIGDMLIKEVGACILKCVRKEDTIARYHSPIMLDTVARLGGDEFTILLSEIKEPGNASKVAERIMNSLSEPITLDDKRINVTVSIGIAIYPDDADNVETLLKNADIAMYVAKKTGKNSFRYYSQGMNSIASKRLNLESELNKALENSELTLYYQPFIDLKNSRVFAVEALLRWIHPEKGILLPNDFIPVAEETGLIINFGEYVFNLVGKHYSKWREEGIPDICFSINISPKQLYQKDFLNNVIQSLSDYNISPENVIIEITESCIIHDIDRTNKIIDLLREIGIKIALDDFGSGYSSFIVLKKTNLDFLKIDRLFIKEIPANKEDATIVASLISIGHSRNLKVIAEGIENKEQLLFLKENDCDYVQGFYFSVPVPEDEVIGIINEKY